MRRKKSFRHAAWCCLQIIGAYPVTGAGIRCCCFWKEAEVKAEARARFVDGGSVSIAAVFILPRAAAGLFHLVTNRQQAVNQNN